MTIDKFIIPFSAVEFHGKKVNKVDFVDKTGIGLDPDRPAVAAHEATLRTTMERVLKRLRTSVIQQLKAKRPDAAKADEPDDAPDDFDLDTFLAELDLTVLELAEEDLLENLAAVFEDGARTAFSIVGPSARTDLYEQVNERALNWAREEAARLVGLSDDPKFALTDTTRDMIRNTIAQGIEDNLSTGDIADQLEDAYAFSPDRAETIASTEITSANSEGALDGYQEAAAMGIDVGKSWLVLEDGCPVCQANADAGVIDLDEDFPSGDAAPGAHPHCRCVLVPEVRG